MRRKAHIARHCTGLSIFRAFILLIFLTRLHVFRFPWDPFLSLSFPNHSLVDRAFYYPILFCFSPRFVVWLNKFRALSFLTAIIFFAQKKRVKIINLQEEKKKRFKFSKSEKKLSSSDIFETADPSSILNFSATSEVEKANNIFDYNLCRNEFFGVLLFLHLIIIIINTGCRVKRHDSISLIFAWNLWPCRKRGELSEFSLS